MDLLDQADCLVGHHALLTGDQGRILKVVVMRFVLMVLLIATSSNREVLHLNPTIIAMHDRLLLLR